MCFSSNASFGAGVILTAIGVATIKNVKQPHQYYFALIPLLFAIQQFSEGFVWLSLQNSAYINLLKPATYTFLVFAQVVWPIWVPYSILRLEKLAKHKRMLIILLGIGILTSAYLSYCLLNYSVIAEIHNHHIFYSIELPIKMLLIINITYVLSTIAPTFLSAIHKVQFLALTILTSFLVSKIFFEDVLISVFCFLAALISVIVWIIILELKTVDIDKTQLTYSRS